MTRAYDVLGNVAIVNFPKDFKLTEKKKFARKIMKYNKGVTTVLEKTGKVKGRLRKPTLKHIAGEKTKEVLYKENGCVFRFNVETTYFSPRLSNERKEIAEKVKKGDDVFVMFAGVAPFSIVIAKNSRAKKIYSNEINREANKYAKLNVELNKVKDRVELVNGDVKKVVGKLCSRVQNFLPHGDPEPPPTRKKLSTVLLNSLPKKFNVIVMPRPQLKDSFLQQAFAVSKKGTRIFYYDFCKVDETKLIVNKIRAEARQAGKKVRILNVKKAGEIAPYKIRVRVDFGVL